MFKSKCRRKMQNKPITNGNLLISADLNALLEEDVIMYNLESSKENIKKKETETKAIGSSKEDIIVDELKEDIIINELKEEVNNNKSKEEVIINESKVQISTDETKEDNCAKKDFIGLKACDNSFNNQETRLESKKDSIDQLEKAIIQTPIKIEEKETEKTNQDEEQIIFSCENLKTACSENIPNSNQESFLNEFKVEEKEHSICVNRIRDQGNGFFDKIKIANKSFENNKIDDLNHENLEKSLVGDQNVKKDAEIIFERNSIKEKSLTYYDDRDLKKLKSNDEPQYLIKEVSSQIYEDECSKKLKTCVESTALTGGDLNDEGNLSNVQSNNIDGLHNSTLADGNTNFCYFEKPTYCIVPEEIMPTENGNLCCPSSVITCENLDSSVMIIDNQESPCKENIGSRSFIQDSSISIPKTKENSDVKIAEKDQSNNTKADIAIETHANTTMEMKEDEFIKNLPPVNSSSNFFNKVQDAIKVSHNFEKDFQNLETVSCGIQDDLSPLPINENCIDNCHLCSHFLEEMNLIFQSKMKSFQSKMEILNTILKEFDHKSTENLNRRQEEIEKLHEEFLLEKRNLLMERDIELKNICETFLEENHHKVLNKFLVFKNNLSGISSSVGLLKDSLINRIDKIDSENEILKAEIRSLRENAKEVENENQMLLTKNKILEENADYIHRQNETLKKKNNALLIFKNESQAMISNMKKSLLDFKANLKDLEGVYFSIQNELNEKEAARKKELNQVSEKISEIQNQACSFDLTRLKDLMRESASLVKAQYEKDIESLEKAKMDLLEELNSNRSELVKIRIANDELMNTNNEIKEEIGMKESYSKELEKSTDELMKSNRFYEDQLIASDNVIKELKESKTKISMEFGLEIEKIKKSFIKENGLLKLRIEELESQLASKMEKIE